MAFTKIAIFGATGNVGTPIAKELIAKFKSGVVVFTRPDSATTTADKKALLDEFTAGGSKVVPVDLTNVA